MVERQIGNIVLVTSILLNGPERNMKLQAFVYNLDWWGWGTSEYCSTLKHNTLDPVNIPSLVEISEMVYLVSTENRVLQVTVLPGNISNS